MRKIFFAAAVMTSSWFVYQIQVFLGGNPFLDAAAWCAAGEYAGCTARAVGRRKAPPIFNINMGAKAAMP